MSVNPDQAPLRLRIRDLAQTRMRYGYYRIYIMLRREGWLVNHKRVYRLYRQDGLSLRLKKPRRNVSAADRVRQPAAAAPNEMWSMDFVSDALFDGCRLRALTVVDTVTCEALAIYVYRGIKGEQVVEAMARTAGTRGRPERRRVPERALVPVAGRCSGQDRGLAKLLQRSRPHTSLGWLTPNEYAAAATHRAAECSPDTHLQTGGKSGGLSPLDYHCSFELRLSAISGSTSLVPSCVGGVSSNAPSRRLFTDQTTAPIRPAIRKMANPPHATLLSFGL